MKYRLIDASNSTWKDIAEKSYASTFFHTPAWAKILSDTFPVWKNATFGIEYDDGNRAILPLMKRSIIGKLPNYWYESTVPGVYGGPIFQKPPSRDHFKAINDELSQFDNILISSNPFFDWRPTGDYSIYDTFIQFLRLDPDFARIWKNFSKGRRHTINYAKKQGVIVKEVEFLEHYQAYFDIYRIQLKRWGRTATNYYPIKLFKNLATEAASNSNIKLWTAWLNGKMISGMVIFYHNKHVATWHGATLDGYFEYRPVDLLYSTAIENACCAGYEIFDFTSSGGHDNVVFFKERYGAIRLPFTLYRRKNIGGLLFRAIRYLRTFLHQCPED